MRWVELFEDNNIDYASRGPNISPGWLGIQCPFCGELDPSKHLGVNLTTGGWNCWRDATHRGATPNYLVRTLLGVTAARARALVQAYSGSNPDSFDAPAVTVQAPQAKKPKVALLPEFSPIEGYSLTHKFWTYLWNRGFDDPNQVVSDYNLKACLYGRWKGRLIIPVYDGVGDLIGWQGRALVSNPVAPRYLSSSETIKQGLFNLNQFKDGETLFVCEGPFDALKLDYYGKGVGVRATCTFGVIPTIQQICLLNELKVQFKRVVLLFDNDSAAVSAQFGLADWLSGIELMSLPPGVKDPGQMSATQIRRFLSDVGGET
jgi:hypothetical protein